MIDLFSLHDFINFYLFSSSNLSAHKCTQMAANNTYLYNPQLSSISDNIQRARKVDKAQFFNNSFDKEFLLSGTFQHSSQVADHQDCSAASK